MNNSIKEMELSNLESTKKNQAQIKIFSFENEEAEMSFLLEYLKETNEKLNDIFILSRTNKQLNNIATMLRKLNINFILKTEENFDVLSKDNYITLATIHTIKGLEAKTVFLIGCNNQNFPCRASDNPIVECIKNEYYDRESEELRLFYVAISRAKEKLFITYSGTQSNFITEDMKKLLR
jgi:superfamily I DNA/RNA helicase